MGKAPLNVFRNFLHVYEACSLTIVQFNLLILDTLFSHLSQTGWWLPSRSFVTNPEICCFPTTFGLGREMRCPVSKCSLQESDSALWLCEPRIWILKVIRIIQTNAMHVRLPRSVMMTSLQANCSNKIWESWGSSLSETKLEFQTCLLLVEQLRAGQLT